MPEGHIAKAIKELEQAVILIDPVSQVQERMAVMQQIQSLRRVLTLLKDGPSN